MTRRVKLWQQTVFLGNKQQHFLAQPGQRKDAMSVSTGRATQLAARQLEWVELIYFAVFFSSVWGQIDVFKTTKKTGGTYSPRRLYELVFSSNAQIVQANLWNFENQTKTKLLHFSLGIFSIYCFVSGLYECESVWEWLCYKCKRPKQATDVNRVFLGALIESVECLKGNTHWIYLWWPICDEDLN